MIPNRATKHLASGSFNTLHRVDKNLLDEMGLPRGTGFRAADFIEELGTPRLLGPIFSPGGAVNQKAYDQMTMMMRNFSRQFRRLGGPEIRGVGMFSDHTRVGLLVERVDTPRSRLLEDVIRDNRVATLADLEAFDRLGSDARFHGYHMLDAHGGNLMRYGPGEMRPFDVHLVRTREIDDIGAIRNVQIENTLKTRARLVETLKRAGVTSPYLDQIPDYIVRLRRFLGR